MLLTYFVKHSGKLVLKKEQFQFKKKVEKTFNTSFYKLDTKCLNVNENKSPCILKMFFFLTEIEKGIDIFAEQ